MANKPTSLLFRALVEVSEVSCCKVVRGNPSRSKTRQLRQGRGPWAHRPQQTRLPQPIQCQLSQPDTLDTPPRTPHDDTFNIVNARHLGACRILATRGFTLPLSPSVPITTSNRSFINLAAPISARRMEYSESRMLGYTPEQMYSVVASVDQYQHFVPWCKKSRIMRARNGNVLAELEIGFPPIVERYTSEVTVIPNHQVRAVCTDGSLFSHLETIWRFAPGAKDQPNSCMVEFNVSFEFKYLLHSQLANIFFDEVVKQMVSAFELQAAKLHGSHLDSLHGAPVKRRSA